uniref:Calcineurin B-like n=1 Tax=Oryza sativa subsp. japonica TaxID=39947 RepID=Q5Z7W5_ORYSJ|nr:calcineurin B-like [Oryza sativa Japonica Group]
MTSATTSPPAAARRLGRLGRCTLAGERRLYGTNGGHQDVDHGAANSPMTKTSAEDQRTAAATRKKRRRRSGRRRRRCSGGLRRRRRSGRGRRRLGDHDGDLPKRRRRPERRRCTAGATATTAARSVTALGRFRRREAKVRVATGRGELGGPFKGASERRRRPTATGGEKERSDWREKSRSESNSNPRISKPKKTMIPKEKRKRRLRRSFPLKRFGRRRKGAAELESGGGAARLGFRAAAAARGRRT